MLTTQQEMKILNSLQVNGFRVNKSWLPNSVTVSQMRDGVYIEVSIALTRLDEGVAVLWIDPLPLTCKVNLYPTVAKKMYAELTLILSRLNVAFNKLEKNHG